MATSDVTAGLAAFRAIGVTSSGTGTATVTGGPAGKVAVAIDVGGNATVVAGAESSTTDGTYTFARSGTTAGRLTYLIL